ncbi:unnamed protein product, partial [Adineta ricciae]
MGYLLVFYAALTKNATIFVLQLLSSFSIYPLNISQQSCQTLNSYFATTNLSRHIVLPNRSSTELREIIQRPASYAQARIWLDEQVRFDPDKPQVAIYNMPFLYHILPSAT